MNGSSRRKMRVLLCTHHLNMFSGSELVILELAEEFSRQGAECTIFSPFLSGPWEEIAKTGAFEITTHSADIYISSFDIVFCQHQTQSLLFESHNADLVRTSDHPFFVFAHLSPFEPFERPGIISEFELADLVLANSAETIEMLEEFPALLKKSQVFPNPAPKAFERVVPKLKEKSIKGLKLLSVSNHLPDELKSAFFLLEEKGHTVTRFGAPENNARLTPNVLQGHDAVISIGKTVQYALRAQVPIYCYDHFGGPGWLTEANFEHAARFNFSGRPEKQKRSDLELIEEIETGFKKADGLFQNSDNIFDRFRLEDYVSKIIYLSHAPREPHVISDWNWYEHERQIYSLINREYSLKRIYEDDFAKTDFLKRKLFRLLTSILQMGEQKLTPETLDLTAELGADFFPGNVLFKLHLAQKLASENKLDEAEKIYLELEENSPPPVVFVHHSQLAEKSGRLKKAIGLMEAAVDSRPEIIPWLVRLCVLITKDGNSAEALSRIVTYQLMYDESSQFAECVEWIKNFDPSGASNNKLL